MLWQPMLDADACSKCPASFLSNGGRFLAADPMGHAASMSLYDYAGGDPINFVDPRGRSAKATGVNAPVVASAYSPASADGMDGFSLSDYTDGVVDFGMGLWDSTLGGLLGVGQTLLHLPGNTIELVSNLTSSDRPDYKYIALAAAQHYDGYDSMEDYLSDAVAKGAKAYGQRLANGDNRALGQVTWTALTLGYSVASKFATVVEAVDAVEAVTIGEQVFGVPDEAFVHFSPKSLDVVKGINSPDVFGFQFGQIRNFTPRQIQSLIGPGAAGGQTGGAAFMHVLDTGGAIFELRGPLAPTTTVFEHVWDGLSFPTTNIFKIIE